MAEASNRELDFARSVSYLRSRGGRQDHEAADLLTMLQTDLNHERMLARTERSVLRKIRELFGLETEPVTEEGKA